MAIDTRPLVIAAAQGALDELRAGGQRKRKRGSHLPARRALLLGAGAVTAVRLAMRLRGRSVFEDLQDRLLEYEERHFGDEERFDDPDELDEDSDDFDEEEPEEDDEQLEDEADADIEDEAEVEDDEDLDDDEDFDDEAEAETEDDRVRA